MAHGNSPFQLSLPFPDLPPTEENGFAGILVKSDVAENSFSNLDEILGHKDSTLLFMTMAVSMTAKNEMPMARAYTGNVPQDIRGCYRISSSEMSHIAPHFYLDDYVLKSYWEKPFETADFLSNFEVSIGMDLSMTKEMGRPQKEYASFLNKLWDAWLQSRGIKVIPNVSFPDEWWEDYWLEGWPQYSVIAVSSVGVTRRGNVEKWLKAFDRIRCELRPIHIVRYGPRLQGENAENCTYFDNDNNRAAYGWK